LYFIAYQLIAEKKLAMRFSKLTPTRFSNKPKIASTPKKPSSSLSQNPELFHVERFS
jgi:hypothetical protein